MNDAVSSRGVHHTSNEADPQGFLIGSANTRRVEPRNTPSVINAVFNHRQFWDERAENVFNGINHLGKRDPDAKVFRAAFRTTEHLPLTPKIAIARRWLRQRRELDHRGEDRCPN
jgi:hypothetical protein